MREVRVNFCICEFKCSFYFNGCFHPENLTFCCLFGLKYLILCFCQNKSKISERRENGVWTLYVGTRLDNVCGTHQGLPHKHDLKKKHFLHVFTSEKIYVKMPFLYIYALKVQNKTDVL